MSLTLHLLVYNPQQIQNPYVFSNMIRNLLFLLLLSFYQLSGQTLIKDINSQAVAASTGDSWMVTADNRVLFSLYMPESGLEPWIADGTAAGNRQLADVFPGTQGAKTLFLYHAANQGLYYFVAMASNTDNFLNQYELWCTDLTPAGTRALWSLHNHYNYYDTNIRFAEMQGIVYFISPDGKLYRTDGTKAGTQMLKTLVNPPSYNLAQQSYLYTAQSRLWINAASASGISLLWSSDGTEDGTHVLKVAGDTLRSKNNTRPFGSWQNQVYFTAIDASKQLKMYRYEAATSAPEFVCTLAENVEYTNWVGETSQHCYWEVRNPAAGSGLALLKTNGDSTKVLNNYNASHGSMMVSGRLVIPIVGSMSKTYLYTDTDSSLILLNHVLNKPYAEKLESWLMPNHLYFAGSNGMENMLYRTDGTPEGTVELMPFLSFTTLIPFRNKVYMISIGGKLYETDGTPEGSRLLPISFNYNNQVRMLGAGQTGLIFTLKPSTHSFEIRKLDTLNQVSTLFAIPQTSTGSSLPENFCKAAEDLLFFTTRSGKSLWRTDGTTEGTQKVCALPAHPFYTENYLPLGRQVVYNGRKFPFNSPNDDSSYVYVADESVNECRLVWSEKGGFLGKNIVSSTHFYFQSRNSQFFAYDGSDLSALGSYHDITSRFVWENKLFFRPLGSNQQYELWRTEGTLGSTQLKWVFPAGEIVADRKVGPYILLTIKGNAGYYRINMQTEIMDVIWAQQGCYANNFFYLNKQIYLLCNETGLFVLDEQKERFEQVWQYPAFFGSPAGVYDAKASDTHLFIALSDSPNIASIYVSQGKPNDLRRLLRLNYQYSDDILRPYFYGKVVGDSYYYGYKSDSLGMEWGRSDGTEEGTILLADMYKGVESGFYDTRLTGVAQLGNQLIFGAADARYGAELWKMPVKTPTLPDKQLFLVYPNPAQNQLHIQFDKNQSLKRELYMFNVLGQLFLSAQTENFHLDLDVSALPNGIYYLQLDSAEGTQSQAVMIAR